MTSLRDGALPHGRKPLKRNRAFTLFMRAYDDTRRAAIYLRWQEAMPASTRLALRTRRSSNVARK